MSEKTILIAGDHGTDYDVYLHADDDDSPYGARGVRVYAHPPGTPPTLVRVTSGGAGIVHRVLEATTAAIPAGSKTFNVRFVQNPGSNSEPTVAIWHRFPLGVLARVLPDDKKPSVWRTSRSLNLGRLDEKSLLLAPQAPLPLATDDAPLSGVILVLEDNAGYFRFHVPDTIAGFLKHKGDDRAALIVLKTCAPVCHGDVWWSLAASAELLDRLVVIVACDDLRRNDIRVERDISWERTAEDLSRELSQSPTLAELRRARHVIVTFQGDGALWVERTTDTVVGHPPQFRFRLWFDPTNMEGEWADGLGALGNAYGFHSCFAAAVAARGAMAPNPLDRAAIESGIESGLLAMRALLVLGHGMATTGTSPGLPAQELGQLLAASDLTAFAKLRASDPILWSKLGTFGRAEVPAPSGSSGGSAWRILESVDGVPKDLPLHGRARRVALIGLPALANVPSARFGGLFTVDRAEIEALRNLKRLMATYDRETAENKPLSIAVFGPPGAGKSFGIKQIAKSVIDEKRQALLEFNLSQFSDERDLIGAFHQVRDKVLEGKLPVVFWDEFDAQRYRWLQFLLAPMQDGKFQEGQITHPIGRCVFVFAGATSYTHENFGPTDVAPSAPTEDLEGHRAALADFTLKKGPDFKSRLHGCLNVLGPNPRQRFNGTEWEDDPTDVCFPVRRAVLLRSLLGLMDAKHGRDRLTMDAGLLASLLEVGHYTHGSRSFEKLLQSLKQTANDGYRRSGLPTDEVLAMNVKEYGEFKAILDQASAFQKHADALAAAVHARWLVKADRENTFRRAFQELPEEVKGDNRAAALRIPAILALLGLELVPADDERAPVADFEAFLEPDFPDMQAEEEHIGWMDLRLRNGWKPTAFAIDDKQRQKDRAARLHDCLIPYKELPDAQRGKDVDAVLWYPSAAALVGFKIVAKGARRR
ncbi:MAG: AAA family ATPase [Vicinamibacterales bacterium]